MAGSGADVVVAVVVVPADASGTMTVEGGAGCGGGEDAFGAWWFKILNRGNEMRCFAFAASCSALAEVRRRLGDCGVSFKRRSSVDMRTARG